jgi:hypothetical protein
MTGYQKDLSPILFSIGLWFSGFLFGVGLTLHYLPRLTH